MARVFEALACSVLGQGLPYEEHDLGSKAEAVGQIQSLQLTASFFLKLEGGSERHISMSAIASHLSIGK